MALYGQEGPEGQYPLPAPYVARDASLSAGTDFAGHCRQDCVVVVTQDQI
jgi:hypothetical protein